MVNESFKLQSLYQDALQTSSVKYISLHLDHIRLVYSEGICRPSADKVWRESNQEPHSLGHPQYVPALKTYIWLTDRIIYGQNVMQLFRLINANRKWRLWTTCTDMHLYALKLHLSAVNSRQYVGVITPIDAHNNGYLVSQSRVNYMVRNGAKAQRYSFLLFSFFLYVHIIYDLASSCFQGDNSQSKKMVWGKQCAMRLPVSSSN